MDPESALKKVFSFLLFSSLISIQFASKKVKKLSFSLFHVPLSQIFPCCNRIPRFLHCKKTTVFWNRSFISVNVLLAFVSTFLTRQIQSLILLSIWIFWMLFPAQWSITSHQLSVTPFQGRFFFPPCLRYLLLTSPSQLVTVCQSRQNLLQSFKPSHLCHSLSLNLSLRLEFLHLFPVFGWFF